MILNNYIKTDEIKTFKPAGCYDLQVDQCLVCNKNPDGSTKMKKTPVVTTEIKNGKKIPQDVSLGGFNNSPISQLVSPSLTTVDNKAIEQGIECAVALESILLGNTPKEKTILKILSPNLIVRESS